MYSSFCGQPREVADAIVGAVEERADVRLVDDGVLVPETGFGVFGHARAQSLHSTRLRAAAARPAVQAGCARRATRGRAGRSCARPRQ